MNCKIGGRYFLEVLNADGVVVKTAEFENMILDGALTRWSNGTVGFNSGPYFCVGTGTSTPVANQTALDSLLAGSLSGSRATYVVSPTNEDRGSSVYRASTAYTYTYSIGQPIFITRFQLDSLLYLFSTLSKISSSLLYSLIIS